MNIIEATKLLIDGYVLSSFAENTRFIFYMKIDKFVYIAINITQKYH